MFVLIHIFYVVSFDFSDSLSVDLSLFLHFAQQYFKLINLGFENFDFANIVINFNIFLSHIVQSLIVLRMHFADFFIGFFYLFIAFCQSPLVTLVQILYLTDFFLKSEDFLVLLHLDLSQLNITFFLFLQRPSPYIVQILQFVDSIQELKYFSVQVALFGEHLIEFGLEMKTHRNFFLMSRTLLH